MLLMFKFAILFFSVVMKYGQNTVLYRPHDTFTSSVAPISAAARHADVVHIDKHEHWHAAGINDVYPQAGMRDDYDDTQIAKNLHIFRALIGLAKTAGMRVDNDKDDDGETARHGRLEAGPWGWPLQVRAGPREWPLQARADPRGWPRNRTEQDHPDS